MSIWLPGENKWNVTASDVDNDIVNIGVFNQYFLFKFQSWLDGI